MLHQPLPPQASFTQFVSDKSISTDGDMVAQDFEEQSRGRRRSRDLEHDEAVDNAGGTSPDGEPASGGPSRKRRRSRKGLDKKFDCPHDGCGKSYSRAEHLYRHQLNHNPKQIYKCDFPDCRRHFVRQDLCARHKERHTARGSQLQRKDALLQTLNPTGAPPRDGLAPHLPAPDPLHDGRSGLGVSAAAAYVKTEPYLGHGESPVPQAAYGSSPDNGGNPLSPVSANAASTMTGSMSSGPSRGAAGNRLSSTPTSLGSQTAHSGLKRQDSNGKYRRVDGPLTYDGTGATVGGLKEHGPRSTSFGAGDSQSPHSPRGQQALFARPGHHSTMASTPNLSSLSLSSPYGPSPMTPHGSGGPTGQAGYAPYVGSPADYRDSHAAMQPTADLHLPASGSVVMSVADATAPMPGAGPVMPMPMPTPDTSLFEQMAPPYTFPVFGDAGFGDENYTRSPCVMGDNFAAWLFNSEQQQLHGAAASRQNIAAAMNAMSDGVAGAGIALGPDVGSGAAAAAAAGFHAGYLGHELGLNGFLPTPIPQQHPMAVTSILDTSPPESLLSEARRQELIDLIVQRFNESDHAPVVKQKEALLEGERDDDGHVLSLRMMRTYIVSYWDNFHPQLPILHRPTFVADKTPLLLLIAMMTIGGTCLDKMHGHDVTQAAASLAQFLAWHLRWAIFGDVDFRPPAKLWVFQALLLLETYEKMYASRALHERAHIHHATTITLMRRGSSLIGRSPLGSPPMAKDERGGRANGSTPSGSGANTPEKWWQRWITSEATRRAAFAAFVIDSIHATMFGHNAIMVAHEMRLLLPCDEALWSAPSSAEVGRIEAGLLAKGQKPVTFLEGLKCTLGGQSVRTNSFGQTILMAGLLSVSWHMHQRDLQVHSLGVSQALGGRDKWRVALVKSFDVWSHGYPSPPPASTGSKAGLGLGLGSGASAAEAASESRTVLHHLAHMAMHVDIVDCQIFAGASRLLGRGIGPQDYKSAQRRMIEWAPKAQARDAAFYALRFLCQVLLPAPAPWQSTAVGMVSEYSAREDSVLNRPWVLYFAALTVWSYGFALEGPVAAGSVAPSTVAQQHHDMSQFLTRLGRLDSPDNLSASSGRNGCAGTLIVLSATFRDTRWELLHEAAHLLDNCVRKLYGGA